RVASAPTPACAAIPLFGETREGECPCPIVKPGRLKFSVQRSVIDLFPPGSHGPAGLHAAIWAELGAADDDPPWPADKPLTLASYMAAPLPEAFLEPIAVSDVLPEMPLFLQVDGHIAVPLEATYQAAYRGMPAYWRGKLEASGSTR